MSERRFENTPFLHEEVGYTLKVVNGPKQTGGYHPRGLPARVPFASVQRTVSGFVEPPRANVTVGSCYQVATPDGNILLKAWTPQYYNPPLAYDRCEAPRPFGPRPTGCGGCKCGQGGLSCGGGACGEGSCGCGCGEGVPESGECTGNCPCGEGGCDNAGCPSCEPVMMGYAGESDQELGPSYRKEKYQSGYFAPQYVNGPRFGPTVAGVPVVAPPQVGGGVKVPTAGRICMQQPCYIQPTQFNYLRWEPRAQTMPITGPIGVSGPCGGPCAYQRPANIQRDYRCIMDAFQDDLGVCPRQFQGYWNPWGQVN